MENQSTSIEEKMQRLVQWTLLGGVLSSCSLLLIGTLHYFHLKTALPQTSPSVVYFARNFLHLTGIDITFAGLLVLMVTPVIRMMVLVFGFFLERDWQFVWYAIAVLAALLICGIYSIG